MSRASLIKMKLSKDFPTKTITFNEEEIKVRQYLPAFDKISLVAGAVRSATVSGSVNNLILDISVHFGIIENYTNINFTDKMKENVLDTFDLVQSSGLMAAVLEEIPVEEYEDVFASAKSQAEKVDRLTESAISGYVSQIEGNAQMSKIIEEGFLEGIVGKEDEIAE